MQGPRYVGTVKKFMSGWGFIVCDQVQGDIFVNGKSFAQGPNQIPLQHILQQGDKVQFELTQRADPMQAMQAGKNNNSMQAMNVTRLGGSANPMDYNTIVNQLSQAVMQRGPGGMMMGAQNSGNASTQMGALQSFNAESGWGWIKCAATGSDVFFGLKDNPHMTPMTLNVGDSVMFGTGINQKTGKPKAVNVQASRVGQRVQGTVREMRGDWGFANSPGMDTGILLGQKTLQTCGLVGLQAGEMLEFELAQGKKGYEAKNIQKIF